MNCGKGMLIFLAVLISCVEDDDVLRLHDKCVCFYVMADNDLGTQATKLLEDISTFCYNAKLGEEDKIVVFLDNKQGGYLYESSSGGAPFSKKIWFDRLF